MSSQLPSINPTGYVGVRPTNPPNVWYRNKAPINTVDVNNYVIGDEWVWSVPGLCWKLLSITNQPNGSKLANWVSIVGGGGGGIQTLTCDNGVVVPPSAGNINVLGTAIQGISTAGNLGGTVTLNVQNADTAGNKGVATFFPPYFQVVAGIVLPAFGDSAGTVGMATFNDLHFNAVAGHVNSNIANTIGGLGVATFDPADFTVTAGGLVSAVGTVAGFTWVAAPASIGITANQGYYVTASGAVTLTLPAIAPAGSIIKVVGSNPIDSWIIAQNAGQNIFFKFGISTTIGVGGSVSSTDSFDSIDLLCTVDNTSWVALNVKGNVTVV